MQAQIPQELSALMALSQGMQQGRVAATTPEGAPTVAAQTVGQVEQGMMPGMQQTVGQAGLGAQIKAMQMQEAQQAMMNAAMQQAKGPAGIEGLNPQVGRFAEGGIVGYAEAGTVASMLNPEQYALEVEMLNAEAEARRAARLRRDDAERLAFLETAAPEVAARLKTQQAPAATAQEVAAPPPSAPPPPLAAERQPSAARPSGGRSGIADLFERERAGYASMKGPATPEEILAQEQREAAIQDQYLRSKGLPTTTEMFAARGAEDKSLIDQQRALLRERMEREQGRDTFLGRMGEALRGFSQMQGQGIGSGLTRSYDALARRLAAGETRMDQMRDIEIKINELEINRRRALDDARRATAEGDWKRAQQRMGEANAFENAQKKLTAGTFSEQAKAVLEERKIAEAAAGRAETAAGRSEQEKSRQMLAAQGRLTEAEKARSQVVEKNQKYLGFKDAKDPATKQLYESAQREISQADRNVAEARSLYNSILNQTLGVQPSAGVKTAVNPQTNQRIMSTDGGKTWQPAR